MPSKLPRHNPGDSSHGAAVARQVRAHGIRDPRVLDALSRISRARFLPPDQRAFADDDRALSIGLEQTISQPFMVAVIVIHRALPNTPFCCLL